MSEQVILVVIKPALGKRAEELPASVQFDICIKAGGDSGLIAAKRGIPP